MSDPKPTRSQGDLAEMLEMLLDKGVVVNADIAVSIGDTELLGIELRAAIASFETAAKYGLEFPTGTDIERVETAAGVSLSSEDTTADESAEANPDAKTGADNQSLKPADQSSETGDQRRDQSSVSDPSQHRSE